MIISIDAEKSFGQNPASIYNKTLSKVGIKATLIINIIKSIYGKPTANTILKGEKVKAIPLR